MSALLKQPSIYGYESRILAGIVAVLGELEAYEDMLTDAEDRRWMGRMATWLSRRVLEDHASAQVLAHLDSVVSACPEDRLVAILGRIISQARRAEGVCS